MLEKETTQTGIERRWTMRGNTRHSANPRFSFRIYNNSHP